jgi:hypothetical protein
MFMEHAAKYFSANCCPEFLSCRQFTMLTFSTLQVTTTFICIYDMHTVDPRFYVPAIYVFPPFATLFQVPSISLYS